MHAGLVKVSVFYQQCFRGLFQKHWEKAQNENAKWMRSPWEGENMSQGVDLIAWDREKYVACCYITVLFIAKTCGLVGE